MKTFTLVMMTLVVSCSLTGCAKIRQMTRRDFSVLSDPFLEPSTDSEDGLFADGSGTGTEGVARVGSSGPLAGNRIATASESPVSRETAFRNAVQSRTIVPSKATDELTRIARGTTATQANSDSQEIDMVEMSGFMRQEAQASGLTETVKDLEKDFDAFAANRKEEWKEQMQQARDNAKSELRQASNQASGFAESEFVDLPEMAVGLLPQDTEQAEPLIKQLSGVTEARAAASNSVRQAVARHSEEDAWMADFDRFAEAQLHGTPTEPQTPAPVPNPFADFEEPPTIPTPTIQPPTIPTQRLPVQQSSQPTVDKAAAAHAAAAHAAAAHAAAAEVRKRSTAKLDDNFGFDEGWRPADMKRR